MIPQVSLQTKWQYWPSSLMVSSTSHLLMKETYEFADTNNRSSSKVTCWRPYFLWIGIPSTTALQEVSRVTPSIEKVDAHHCASQELIRSPRKCESCESVCRALPATHSQTKSSTMSAASRVSGTRVHLFNLHPSVGSRHTVSIFQRV
jgi:hypothetical protein